MGCFIEDFRMRVASSNRICSKPRWPSFGEVSQLPVLDDDFGLPIEPPFGHWTGRNPAAFLAPAGCMGANPTGRWAMTEDGEGVGFWVVWRFRFASRTYAR